MKAYAAAVSAVSSLVADTSLTVPLRDLSCASIAFPAAVCRDRGSTRNTRAHVFTRRVAINATGVGVRAIGEAAGVSKSSVHNFLRGGDLTPDALDALARYVEKHG